MCYWPLTDLLYLETGRSCQRFLSCCVFFSSIKYTFGSYITLTLLTTDFRFLSWNRGRLCFDLRTFFAEKYSTKTLKCRNFLVLTEMSKTFQSKWHWILSFHFWCLLLLFQKNYLTSLKLVLRNYLTIIIDFVFEFIDFAFEFIGFAFELIISLNSNWIVCFTSNVGVHKKNFLNFSQPQTRQIFFAEKYQTLGEN